MRPQLEGTARPHVEKAREFLEGKKWTKAWRLAEGIGISSAVAGQVLSYLPEWEPWNPNLKNRSKRLWRRKE